MARQKIGEMFYDVVANTGKASKKLDKFKAKVDRVGKGMVSAGQRMTLGLTLPIVAGFALATRAAIKQEEVEKRLTVIYGKGSEALIDYAAALQKQTRYGDEAIISGMAFAATFPALRDNMEEVTVAAVNMAEAYGMDLEQAFLLVGKAASGQAGALSRYGISIDTTRVKAEGLEYILSVIAEETKNAAFEIESSGKTLDQFKNEVGDLAEEFGAELIPMLRDAMTTMRPFIDTFKEMTPESKRTVLAIMAIVAGIGPLLTTLGKLIQTYALLRTTAAGAWVAAAGPWGLVGAGAVAGGAAVSLKIQQREREVRDTATRMGQVLGGQRPVVTPRPTTIGPPPGLAGLLEKGFGERFGLQVANMGEPFEALVKLVKELSVGVEEGSEFGMILSMMQSRLSEVKREAEGFKDLLAKMTENLVRYGLVAKEVADPLLELWIPFARGRAAPEEAALPAVPDFGEEAMAGLIADFSSPEAMALAVEIYEEMLQKRAQAEQEVADLVNQIQVEQLDGYTSQMEEEYLQVMAVLDDAFADVLARPEVYFGEAADEMDKRGAEVAASLEAALTIAITQGIMEGELSFDSLVRIIEATVIQVAVEALISGGSVAGALRGIPIIGPLLGIFGLAGGGTLRTSGSVLVGEEGPELLNLPAGARVTPLGKLGNLTTVIELDGREIARKMMPLQAREMQMRGVMG